MFKTTKAKVIGLVLVGAVVLAGAVYATTALAVGGASASPATTQAAQATSGSQLRTTIIDMLKDRMGEPGPDAEQFADQMIARMRNVDADFDFQAMVDWCTQFANAGTDGWGMMGGTDSHDGGWGMMDGSGSHDDGWGMMDGSGPVDGSGSHDDGWGMMDDATTPDAGPSDPSGSDHQDSSSGFTSREMMGEMMGGMMGTPGPR